MLGKAVCVYVRDGARTVLPLVLCLYTLTEDRPTLLLPATN